MFDQGYETGLYYNCKLCKQAFSKRASDISHELIKMRLCPQCYEASLKSIIQNELNKREKVLAILARTIEIDCPDCAGSGMGHKRSGGQTVIAACPKCKGYGKIESTIKETLDSIVTRALTRRKG